MVVVADGEEGNQTEIIAGLWVAIVLTFILTVLLLVGNEKVIFSFHFLSIMTVWAEDKAEKDLRRL